MSDTIEMLFKKGVEFHQLGQAEVASPIYTAILTVQPKHPDANYNMGLLAIGSGKIQAGLTFLETALEANADNAMYWVSYIDVLLEIGRIEDAQAVFDQAKINGAKGEGFDKLKKKLKHCRGKVLEVNSTGLEEKQPEQPNILNSLKLDQAINLAKKNAKEGAPEQAKRIYQDILTKFPKNKRASDGLEGLAGGPVGKASKVQDPPQDQLQALINLYSQGQLQQALEHVETLVPHFPMSAVLFNIQGVLLKSLGQFDLSFTALNKALVIKPDYAAAWYNIGLTLKEQGKLEEAIEAYKKSLAIKPYHADANYSMGVTLQEQGKLEEAIQAYNKALAIEPDKADAYNNIGVTLKEQGKLEEAVKAYNNALTIKPDFATAYHNMANALRDQGKMEEAIEPYNKAIAIEPVFAEAYNNMGIALQEQGKLEAAIEAFNKALAIKPDHAGAWNNILFPLRSIKWKVSPQEELVSYYPKDTGSNYYQIAKSNLNFKINLGGTDAEKSLSESLNALFKADHSVIMNPKLSKDPASSQMELTDKVVALVHFGRSGTGLLHSLIDGHPDVSTLPSIYLSEYFNHLTWKKIISGGWSKMVDNFMAIYDVIFDAKSKVPVQGKSLKLLRDIGLKEGMANVGDQRDEVLKVDKELFHAELKRLMSFYNQLDALLFFKLVHKAYDKAINDINQKSLIFYHIHNPDTHAQLNFVQSAPEANWVMMVREPVQSCEAWLMRNLKPDNYAALTNKITNMLFELDNIIYHKQSSVGVRLEDLKERPRKTIPALCNWMGIEETESLYEMTAQGKKWWGDPVSPDYSRDGMDPFGKTSINRKIGSIFSESDQFILRTLFYPFSVRFGYVEENAEQFEIDLQTIRPMLDEMFDFERTIVEQTHVDPEQFMKSGSYMYLRSGLIERWNILNQFHTYPNMIEPLRVD